MQYALGVPPSLRTNIDYTFILRENITANRKRIYDNYAGMFPSFESFCTVLDQCTNNFECLVIDNTVTSNKIEDCVYWFRAEKRPAFRLGAAQFWLENGQNDSDDSDDEEYFTQEKVSKRKYPINVQKVR
jgi:hypothetical protein